MALRYGAIKGLRPSPQELTKMDKLQATELKRELFQNGKVYFSHNQRGDVINPVFQAIDKGEYNPRPEPERGLNHYENALLTQLKQGVKVRLGVGAFGGY